MAIIKGVGDFFGLDIGTTAVRVVQLSQTAPGKWTLRHYGYAPIDLKTSLADSVEARQRLGEVIMTVVGQSGIKAKNVAIGLSASKTFVTVVDLPMSTPAELKGSIKYQIDEFIPMPLDEAKVDWAALGQSLHDPSQQEVLLASTATSYAEERLELVEGLGFEVIAAEPDSLAMIRSVAAPGQKDAQIIVDIGEQSINVAAVYNGTPRLVRTIPNGLETLVHAAVQNLGIQEDQARQFILKFGLAPDKLEGKVSQALENTLDGFASELSKSIKFFQTRYPSLTVGSVVLAGYASTIPQLDQYIANKTGIQTSVSNPWQQVTIPMNDQNLAAVSAEFAVVVGLAERGGGL
ncbi:MAG: pilM [Candidatus Saccharibacteria bacterium]|nr:pilM [Candidatus Saccharibacteria bacterium]